MSEQTDPFDDRLRRLVGDAVSDAPDAPDLREALMHGSAPTTTTDPTRPDRSRTWLLVASAGLAAAAAVALFVLVPGTGDDGLQPVDRPPDASPVETDADTVPDTAPATTVDAVVDPPTEPTVTTLPAPTTTDSGASTPPAPTAQAAIDLTDATVFGLGYGTPVDADDSIEEIDRTLGSPTADTSWQPVPNDFDPTWAACFGPRFRTVWWGDFRITFEESDELAVRVAAWSVGDPAADRSAPVGPLPPTMNPSGVAADGVGVGATRAEVLAVAPDDGRMIGDTDDQVVVTGAVVTVFELDADDVVTGIGSGRLDCTAGEGL